jgi:hypothetical protein
MVSVAVRLTPVEVEPVRLKLRGWRNSESTAA